MTEAQRRTAQVAQAMTMAERAWDVKTLPTRGAPTYGGERSAGVKQSVIREEDLMGRVGV